MDEPAGGALPMETDTVTLQTSSGYRNVVVEQHPRNSLCFTVNNSGTVSEVKHLIEFRGGPPARVQNLWYRGRQVCNTQTMIDIEENSRDLTLKLLEGKLCGGAPPGEEEGATGGDPGAEDELEILAKKYGISLEDMAKFKSRLGGGAAETKGGGKAEAVHQTAPSNNPSGSSLAPTAACRDAGQEVVLTGVELIAKRLPFIEFNENTATPDSAKFNFRHIFGRKGNNANILENKFDFFLLYDAEKTNLSDDLLSHLWLQIVQKHTARWVDLLQPEEKEGWEVSDNLVKINDEEMEFRLGKVSKKNHKVMKAVPLDSIDGSSEHKQGVLLVDDSVRKAKVQGHFISTKSGKKNISFQGKSSLAFHVHFSRRKEKVSIEWGDQVKNPSQDTNLHPPKNVTKCTPRKFQLEPNERLPYKQRGVLSVSESGDEGRLLAPAHELKLFGVAVKKHYASVKFCREVIEFACACLNSRKNGTIHFGVADEDSRNSSKVGRYSCEIVGVPLREQDQVDLKESLRDAINHCFKVECRDFARKCIGNPVYVPVDPDSADEAEYYVIEVDIEAAYNYTKDKVFAISLHSPTEKCPKVYKSYQRFGAANCPILDEGLQSHVEQLQSVDEKRHKEEQTIDRMGQNMTRQLQNLLVVNSIGKLDETFKRVLVLSAMDESLLPEEFFEKNLPALGNVPWSLVIDFSSKDKRMCAAMSQKLSYDVHVAEDFMDSKLIAEGIRPFHVFGNGFGTSHVPLTWQKWQTSNHVKGLHNLLEKVHQEYPPGRVIILFVVKPGFSKIEALTFGIFLTHFHPNQVAFYIEDAATERKWMEFLTHEYQYIDADQASSRGILGLPWHEFQTEIENLTRGYHRGKVYIPLTKNTLFSVDNIDFTEKSVTIMDVKECDYLHELSKNDGKKFKNCMQYEQEKFYIGNHVSMENLWFTENGAAHVIKRDVLETLQSCLQDVLETEVEKAKLVETITLFYCRGSGGTTVGHHFLWNLFHCKPPYIARCCVVESIKQASIDSIFHLWKMKNTSRLPVVALVDDMPDSDVDNLTKGLTEKILDSGLDCAGTAFIIVRIHASSKPDQEEGDPKVTARLEYLLTDEERTRFMTKYDQMRNTYGKGFEKYKEKSLVSFIMMIQDSREAKKQYAKRLVDSALKDVTCHEYDMLKYLALIHYAVPDDKYMYVASLDPMMVYVSFRKEHYQINWVDNLTGNAKILTNTKNQPVSDDAYSGGESSIAIRFLEFSEAILDYVIKEDQVSLAQVALEFINCQLFPPEVERGSRQVNEFVRDLCYKLYQALQGKRKPRESGKTREVFSKLIQGILRQEHQVLIQGILRQEHQVSNIDLDEALMVMKAGFEKLDRPVLAQQVARLCYIHGSKMNSSESYFQMARDWVQKALRKETNSYFLDTSGRIDLRHLQTSFPKEAAITDPVKLRNAVHLCLESIEWFQQSQRHEISAKTMNAAGYHGELRAMFHLLLLLSRCSVFGEEGDKLRKYLCIRNWKPNIPVPWSDEEENKIKGFRDRFIFCQTKIEVMSNVVKTDDEFSTAEFDEPFKRYFVNLKFDSSDVLDAPVRWSQNWMFIEQYTTCSVFKNVFNIDRITQTKDNERNVNVLEKIKERLTENLTLSVDESKRIKDIFVLMVVKMALHSPFLPKSKMTKRNALEEFYEVSRNFASLYKSEDPSIRKYMHYVYLLVVMFFWPHKNEEMMQTDSCPDPYQDVLNKLQKESQTVQKRQMIIPADHEEIFARRQKLPKTQRYAGLTTLFYLGKGQGLDAYVHTNELHSKTSDGRGRHSGRFINWKHAYISKRLQRLIGKRVNRNFVEYESDGRVLQLEVAMDWRGGQFSLEEVAFYVGFSWKGLLAYGLHRKAYG